MCSFNLGHKKNEKEFHMAPQTSDKSIVSWILHKNILVLLVIETEKIIFEFKNLTI